MKVALIVAFDLDHGIGKNNDLMWNLPVDMRFFKDTTAGQIVIMGRKNYDSIPEKYRPLPGRENVILTRNKEFTAEGCTVFHSLSEALDNYKDEEERTVYIIGGGEIYRQAVEDDVVDVMYISHINHSYGADTFFPKFELRNWAVESILTQGIDSRHSESFITMKYTRAHR
ncbi:MAG: dihydrofolate reductase [Flavobacteriaceae bacterium]|jgi:dihydrofolate reductase